mmetsp:Transcript_40254/g.104912  ORF Transcript_40254/g.104912 Transcript_40254/m.104912 type:complete len:200 (+) Transcript_40254:320-919(+)
MPGRPRGGGRQGGPRCPAPDGGESHQGCRGSHAGVRRLHGVAPWPRRQDDESGGGHDQCPEFGAVEAAAIRGCREQAEPRGEARGHQTVPHTQGCPCRDAGSTPLRDQQPRADPRAKAQRLLRVWLAQDGREHCGAARWRRACWQRRDPSQGRRRQVAADQQGLHPEGGRAGIAWAARAKQGDTHEVYPNRLHPAAAAA